MSVKNTLNQWDLVEGNPLRNRKDILPLSDIMYLSPSENIESSMNWDLDMAAMSIESTLNWDLVETNP